jgi:hypothetical protein
MQLKYMRQFADIGKCRFFNFGKRGKMPQIRVFARRICAGDFVMTFLHKTFDLPL